MKYVSNGLIVMREHLSRIIAIGEKVNQEKMFDFVLSNPPYQDNRNSAIFHHFQQFADKVSNKSSLIYPADKWMTKSGKGIGLDDFATQQLNDLTITDLTVYENSNDIFANIELHGGISIITKDRTCNNGHKISLTTIDFDNVVLRLLMPTPDDRTLSTSNHMNRIVQKIMRKIDDDTKFLSDITCPTSIYGINSAFIENNKDVAISLDDEEVDIPDNYVKVLTNGSSGTQGRVKWFAVPENIIPKKPFHEECFVVAISTRHAAGYGGRSQQARIFAPHEKFGDSRYGVATFENIDEAQNFYTWMSTDLIRILILSSSRRIKNFGVNVPLLPSYKTSDHNNNINFTQTVEQINEQLLDYYELDEQDKEFIVQTIKTLGSFS